MDLDYVSVLRKKLRYLKEEKSKKHNEIKQLLSEIEVLQKSADNIIELLKVEGVVIDSNDMEGLIQESIADIAYDYFNSGNDKKPLHYQDIYNEILFSGKFIPGKNPAANLLTHMSRDKRFIRVSSGTYGLSEWGIQEPTKSKRRKSKRKSTTISRTTNERY